MTNWNDELANIAGLKTANEDDIYSIINNLDATTYKAMTDAFHKIGNGIIDLTNHLERLKKKHPNSKAIQNELKMMGAMGNIWFRKQWQDKDHRNIFI